MNVTLNRIEQLQNGSAHIVFFTDVNTNFAGKFSFVIPNDFASAACKFIVENTFCYGTELDVSIIPLGDGKEMMEITSYIPYNSKYKKVFRLTEYIRENKENE